MNRRYLVLAPRINHWPSLSACDFGCRIDDWLRSTGSAAAPQPQPADAGLKSLRGSDRQLRPPGVDHADAHHGPPRPAAPGDGSGLPRAGKGPCANVGQPAFRARCAGAYTDELPPDLAQGPDRLLRYEVTLNNHAGKSAGPSNAAYSATGPSPPPLIGLTGQMRADGVLLSWQAAAEPGQIVVLPHRAPATDRPSTPRRLPSLPSLRPCRLPLRRSWSTGRMA